MFQYTAPSGITVHSVYPPQEVTVFDTNPVAFFVLSMRLRVQQIKKCRRYARLSTCSYCRISLPAPVGGYCSEICEDNAAAWFAIR